MKKLILLLLLLSSIKSSAQQKNNIDLELNNKTLKESILKIEEKTNFSFYYIAAWLDDSIKINEKFIDASIENILNTLFEKTNLNFYIFEKNKVILTINSTIHNSTYTGLETTIIVNDTTVNVNTKKTTKSAPIYITKTSNSIRGKIVKIGKENSNSNQKTFSLSGYVKNRITNEPIGNMVLLIKNKNIFTTTNSKGFYSFNIPIGTNKIETILLGYKKQFTNLIIYNKGTHNLYVDESTENLDEVVIEANAKKNVRNIVSGITQIKVEEIKLIPQVLGERDLLKAATTLPGVSTASEGSDGVNVRGGKTDQNLFLLDQSVLYNPTHFLGLFSAINPFTTSGFKIFKGNVPAEYGGRISSVFEMTTKNPAVDKFKGEAALGPVTSNVSIELPIIKDKSSLLLAVRGTYSNWILKAIKSKSLNNSSASFFDAIGKYKHQFNENNSLSLAGYYSTDDYSIASDTTNTYQNKILSATWAHKFNDKHKSDLILSNSSYIFDIDFDGKLNRNFNINYNINEYNLKLKMVYERSKIHTFSYGVASKFYVVSPGKIEPKGANSLITPFSVQRDKALESAVYISDEINLNKKFGFSIGARYNVFSGLGGSTQRIYDPSRPKTDASVLGEETYDKFEAYKTYTGLSLRFSSRYSFNEEFSIKASLHNSQQFIHRLSNNTTATPTDIWKLSDLNIKPQEAIQASIGLFKNFDGNDYEISLETYYKKYKNILNYKIGADFLLNKHLETEVLQGPGRSYGVELLIRKNAGKLNGWVSYSYSRSLLKLDGNFAEERINNGREFPTNFDKPHNLNIIANYKLTKRFSLSSNLAFQSGRPITYPIGKYTTGGSEYLVYSDVNKFRIPNYFRLDIGFNAEGNHKLKKIAHSFWSFSIYNVLGRNNPNAIYFVTKEGKIKAYKSSIFSTPIPTLTYNFKF